MISDPRNPAAASTLGPTPWPSQIYERLLCLPKKFEGHGSGEVEVKTGKMPGNSLLPGIKNLEIFGSL